MSDIAKQITELSVEKRQLLERCLKSAGLNLTDAIIIPQRRDTNKFPLSYAQERLWFMDQLEPNRPIYNMPDTHYFKGALGLEALERSLSELVRRHEILRTTFALVDGAPVQVIAGPIPLRLEVVDLSGLGAWARASEAQRLANEEAQQPFDLSRGPLFRMRLLRLGEAEHVLLLTMHHIISDGWSLEVLGRELATLYEAYQAGESSPLAELPIQYADFAVWQREWLRGEVLEQQLGYWREQLGGELRALELPADRPRPARQSYRGAAANIEVSAVVRRRLKEIGREGGATLFMTLLAAFKVVLWRYSGQEEILVGTPIANRNRAETENLIGFFVNTLVLRTQVSGGESFRELLEQVRETTLGAYEHQDVPFEKLVEELQPERSLSHQPLFQVLFALGDWEDLELSGLEWSWMQTDIHYVKFDLTLTMAVEEDRIGGAVIYNVDLFDAATIKLMVGQFEFVLESIAANPDQPLSELPLLTTAEQQMLAAWNDTKSDFPQQCLQDLFQEQVARAPEAVAVVFNEEQLNYEELNRRSNQLAHHLQSIGVGPEVLVGILLERSIELIVGILGVLKAGGAFVPLDPMYPKERLRFMLDDAGLSILLTQQQLLSKLPEDRELRTVCLDSDLDGNLPHVELETITTPDNLAYVIYTSGSTGQPKGVMVQHRGVSNLAYAQREAFEVSANSRVLQFASISFDAAVSEIFKTLLTGATLCQAPSESLLPLDPLSNLLRAQAITTVTLPPSIWAILPTEDLPALHTAISAGEACSAQIAASWGGDGRRFLNAYGPTEVTVCATISDSLDGNSRPPIGRPIANTEVHILNADLRPVPIGVVGELYVGGVGLARGYLSRAALTAERFVPNSFSDQPGSRLYRTGDRVRYRHDGNLEYMGRMDQQVKVRGFRIELGEIETALIEHPAVRDAVVLAREDTAGDVRLVAYLITEPGTATDVGHWRAWLSQKLPEYMLPAAFVLLQEFPLTPNGKVDRRALPAPDTGRPKQAQAYVAPRDRLEQLLINLWQTTLGSDRIGVKDNFFEIGGNSIKGAILINRLQEVLGEYVYVVAIFDAPTVADLAKYLRKHYSEAVNRICGPQEFTFEAGEKKITAAQIAEFKQLVSPLPDIGAALSAVSTNPSAVFVLSPPRSGSTLMRVMLGGHPRLFAPPELELLSYNTLAERREAFADRFSFWREGTIRALMEIKKCDADAATWLMEQCEKQRLTTKQFYLLMQGWLGGRTLVDKTPSYALDAKILQRAESDFADTRYIHLIRHPFAMIRSFENARLEQVFFRHPHNFTRRQLAELIWLVSQVNILEFLQTIPAERQHKVHFEQLVAEPEPVLRGICEFLDLKYVSEMATPYQGASERMTDGIHPLSKMLGDVKFHEHKGVEAATADNWRQELQAGDRLADETWTIAERLGYRRAEVHGPAIAPVSRPELQPIRRVERHDAGLPLSFGQQRLWVIDQLEPGSSAYNIPLAKRVTGPLNVSALEQSFNELVRRHESLRTTFKISAGQPVQVIGEPQLLRLEAVDLSYLPEAERESEAERLTDEESHQPFDLAHGPLLRVRLVKLEQMEHLLLLTMHHIISDGWSMDVLVRELTTLYDSFIAGRPSPLPELPLQYVDFAVWQREWLTGEVLEQQLAHWKRQLEALPIITLPLDRPRPPVRTSRTSHEAAVISDKVSNALREIGQQEGATMFMTLLAAFKLLLARLTEQNDIVVGTPIAGRNRAELEGLIGFFVNTLVLRTRFSSDLTFRELLQRVRSVSLDAYKYQEFPFEKLVDELKPERDPSLTPLFQIMFAFDTVTTGEIQLSGLQFTSARAENESGKFDMTLGMVESKDELVAVLRYNQDLFNRSTIERVLSCFGNLLEEIAADPDRRISQVRLLSPAQRSQLIEQWNQTEVMFPSQCAHRLFEDRVERRPEAIALVFRHEQLSYQELNARANQVAHHLRKLGVGPEVLVGVCVERSVEMIVALLGILKAGGAFVPLDPSYPQERIEFMVADAGLSILLTQEHLRDRIPTRPGLTSLCLDGDRLSIAKLSHENPEVPVMPENLAYAIYTSGSTGQPKGVLLHHGGLSNLALAQAGAFAVSTDSRILQFASFSFDATVSEIFKTLLSGATLCMATAESLMPVTPLLQLLREQRITMVTLPPSVLSVLPKADLPNLRTVISAGEACSAEMAATWSAGGRHFLNAYGPTEITVCATRSEPLDGSCKPPIGRPIANVEAYVLDANLEPVPIGVVGELYIGGVGVARGYLRRPALTAERFIPHPFSQQPGRRLYRTGDLASFREDGQLDYRGRMDQQVKVRGFRIELGEIETVFAQHPDVRDAVVLALDDATGGKRLVAYVVAEAGRTHDAGEWRAWLSQKLPDYMLPSAFVPMEAFPLTGARKIDRAALTAPDAGRPRLDHAYVSPRNQLEQLLVDLWQPVLGLEELGVHDNFFEVGGDSIKGAILINRLQELLGQYVYVVAIFDAPTVAQLADYLRQHYPAAVNRICGLDVAGREVVNTQITREKVVEFRRSIPSLPELPVKSTHKNPPAMFVLSPPRSGSTLLRVMLGGHPQLFAPPELELLSFNTLADRKAAFGERFAFWLEGTLRALMELKQCSAEAAKEIMDQCEAQQLTTQQFYGLLQSWLGARLLVDKTPSYALDSEILRRAEIDFNDTHYIHLIRHPYAMIRSFEEARLEQVFFRHAHDFSRRELAELIWLVSQENILRFLETVPAKRQHRVHFEQLVREPEQVLRGVCEFLDIEYVDAMAAPYQTQGQRMVDGIHPLSKMLGDVKFHEHKTVEAATADRWRRQVGEGDELADETWTIAERLGYQRIDVQDRSVPRVDRKWSPLVELQRGDGGRPLFFVHPVGGNVFCYAQLAHHLGPEQSFYGLQSFGLVDGHAPLGEISEMAGRYIQALQQVQPEGPYLLGGWSMGGIIAFEMAQQLQRDGQEISLLALLDSHTPAALAQYSEINDEELLLQFKSDMSALYDLEGPAYDSDQLNRLFQVFRTNVHAMMGYQPQRYPGRITFFRANDRLADISYDPIEDWRTFATDGVEVHIVPGDHYTMLREPAVLVTAEWLKVCLNITQTLAAASSI